MLTFHKLYGLPELDMLLWETLTYIVVEITALIEGSMP